MSGRYDIVMSYFAEVAVQGLTEKDFSLLESIGRALEGTNEPKDTGPILSTII